MGKIRCVPAGRWDVVKDVTLWAEIGASRLMPNYTGSVAAWTDDVAVGRVKIDDGIESIGPDLLDEGVICTGSNGVRTEWQSTFRAGKLRKSRPEPISEDDPNGMWDADDRGGTNDRQQNGVDDR